MFKEDNGKGYTKDTLKFLDKNLDYSIVKTVALNPNDKIRPVWIFTEKGDQFKVSGFSWGYGGEGPCGLAEVFKKVKIPYTIDDIARWDQIHHYLLRKMPNGVWVISEKPRWFEGMGRRRK